jgi:hypothetical protein
MNTLNRSVHVLEGPTNNPKTRIVLISEWIKRWLGLTQDNGSRLTFELGEEGEDGGDFLITCKTQNDFGSATYEVEVVCRRCQGRRDRSSMRGSCGVDCGSPPRNFQQGSSLVTCGISTVENSRVT